MKKILSVIFALIFCCFVVIYFYTYTFDGYDIKDNSTKALKLGSKLMDLKHLSVLNGKIIQKYPSGEIKIIDEVKDGKIHGTRVMLYKSGSKFANLEFKNGLSDGNVTIWYESGEIKTIGKTKNGKQNGLATEYHKNGTKKREVFYIDDKPDGEFKIWDENANLIQVGIFDKGQPLGIKMNKTDKNGSTAKIGIYKDNNSINLQIDGNNFKF